MATKRDVESLPTFIDTVIAATRSARLGLAITVEKDDEPRIIYANDAALDILGATEEQLIGRSTFLDLPPDEAARLREQRARRLAGDNSWPMPFECTIVRRDDGRHVPIEVGMALVMYEGKRAAVAFFQDITERRRVLEQLTESETRFRQLIEAAPEAITVSRNGRLLYVNPAFVQLVGYSFDELVDTQLDKLMHPDDVPRLRERIARLRAEGGSLPTVEYRMFHKEGHTVEIEVSSIVIEYGGGKSICGFARDVTERNRVRAQLAQNDRLAALGVLAAGVAHEINNPLAYVMLNLTRAVDDLAAIPAAAPVLAYLHETLSGVERVATIARDLGAFARHKPEATGAIDLHGVLVSALKMSAHEISPRARLLTSWQSVPPVMANEARLGQVFVNLLVNAAHAIPEGTPDAHRVEVAVSRAGDRVVIDISDTGTGIALEDQGRIFDPFFTTKRSGTGLGLSICHSIVAGLGGELTVTSHPGRGSTFRVSLAVATDAPKPAAPAAERKPGRRAKVLVVDDEAPLVQALQAILAEDSDVSTATSGAQAIARIGEESFDVILCDLMMSPVSGMEVYRELERRGLADRVVFMTGGTYTPAARDFLASVTNPRIAKPFELEALDRVIADQLK